MRLNYPDVRFVREDARKWASAPKKCVKSQNVFGFSEPAFRNPETYILRSTQKQRSLGKGGGGVMCCNIPAGSIAKRMRRESQWFDALQGQNINSCRVCTHGHCVQHGKAWQTTMVTRWKWRNCIVVSFHSAQYPYCMDMNCAPVTYGINIMSLSS
jgi:hypothetical protein